MVQERVLKCYETIPNVIFSMHNIKEQRRLKSEHKYANSDCTNLYLASLSQKKNTLFYSVVFTNDPSFQRLFVIKSSSILSFLSLFALIFFKISKSKKA